MSSLVFDPCSSVSISYPEPSQTSYCACSNKSTQGSGYEIVPVYLRLAHAHILFVTYYDGSGLDGIPIRAETARGPKASG